MIRLTTRERVDAYWAETLGVDPSDLHVPGTRVRPNPPDRASWRGIYVLSFDKAAVVFAPSNLVELVAAVSQLDADTVLEPPVWHDLLGTAVHVAVGPVLHQYLDERQGIGEVAAGRRLNPGDSAALADLRGAVTSDEWAGGGFTAQPAMLFGLFEGDQMLAAANLNAGPDAATDIGLLVHPRVRGRGYGMRIAATAAKQALLMHGVARLRTPVSSRAGRALAERLGFSEYGRNLAVFLS
jgi:GNAT superfamily N-acetyltransferase